MLFDTFLRCDSARNSVSIKGCEKLMGLFVLLDVAQVSGTRDTDVRTRYRASILIHSEISPKSELLFPLHIAKCKEKTRTFTL